MKAYYYEAAGKQAGPVSADELRAHGVQGNTLVWCETMPTWAPAASVPDLTTFFQPVPTPLPTRSASALTAPAFDQLAPPPLTAGQVPGTRVTAPRPQFSAESSKYRWWHYIILAIVVIILMLLVRTCGAVLEHTITSRGQVLLVDNLAVAMSAPNFHAAGFLSMAGIV